mmetsp:Transcript_4290/g.8212  ORF Transcript_4290/g.8212 Transcript_4290/m.8212 type:complete len:2308 (-) Transcript_4290:59-6982(-)
MTSASYKGNDKFIFSLLTEPWDSNSEEAVTKDDLSSLYSRIVDDVTSPLSMSSSESFWENILSKVSSLGFSIRHRSQVGFNKEQESSQAIVDGGNLHAPPFDTNDGKKHLHAVSSLLGVTRAKAKLLTELVLEDIKGGQRSSGQRSDDSAINSMIGTKELLMRIRDFHYEQQVVRIQIITESIRIESAEDLESNSDKSELREKCIEFLDLLDRSFSWSTSSRVSEQGPFKRGLFKVLLCLSCAPVKVVGREEIYGACDLRDGPELEMDKLSGDSFSSALARNQDFARLLIEQHHEHYHHVIRTAALEALFMLLYQKIDGGIDRTDYIIILQAMNYQEFFVDISKTDDDNRKSQLAALILAECMSLWRIASSRSLGAKTEPLSHSIPFLTNDETAVQEIEIIAHMLHHELAASVLERRRVYFSQMPAGSIDDDKIEEPEAIALLTFGILMKLCHRKAVSGTWMSDAKMKDIAMDCVSCANNDCGAFGYLGKIMSCLLPPSIFSDYQSVSDNFETTLSTEEHAFQEGDQFIDIYPTTGEENTDDSTGVIYASIGREILVGTLSAFQSSLSNTLEASKIDNLGMFCQLAAKIHCNSDVLCQRFWTDWEEAPRDMSASDVGIVDLDPADPLTLLLDLSHSIAMRALSTLGDRSSNVSILSSEHGRQEAAILPCLSPLLNMLASLIPPGNDGATIFKAFLLPEVIHVALLGILHISAKEQIFTKMHDSSYEDHRRILDAARLCMESINILSASSARNSNNDCCEWLKNAICGGNTKPNLGGPDLLQRIAQVAQANSTLEKSISVHITSSALTVMSNLCCQGKSCSWIQAVATWLSSLDRTHVQLLASHINRVSKCFTFLLYQLSRSLRKMIETGSVEENSRFLKSSAVCPVFACEIIAGASCLLDLSDTHISILCNTISAVTCYLREVDSITRFHKNTDVVNEAVVIRDKILHAFTNSTSFGSNVGLLSVVSIVERIVEVQKKNPLRSSFVFENNSASEEKKDGYPSDVSIEYCSTPFTHGTKTIFVSQKALQLLGAWNDVAEHMAKESLDSRVNTSRKIDIENLSSVEKRSLSSTFMTFGPTYLLQSSVPNVPGLKCSFLVLLAKYASMYFESDSHSSYVSRDITLKSIELLSSIIIHTAIDESGEHTCSTLYSSFEYHSRAIGMEMHKALRLLLNMDFCSTEIKNVDLVTEFFVFLRATILITPNLAKQILSGEKHETSVVSQMLDHVKKIDLTKEKGAALVSSFLEILQLIWKQSRNKITREREIKDYTRVHPFSHIVTFLASSNEPSNVCLLLLEKSSDLLSKEYQYPGSHLTTVKYIVYCCLHIIQEDIRNQLEEYAHKTSSAEILQQFARDDKVEGWLQYVGSFATLFSTLKASANDNKVGGEDELLPTVLGANSENLIIHGTSSGVGSITSMEHYAKYFSAVSHDIIVECKSLSIICRFGEMVYCNYLRPPVDAEGAVVRIAQKTVEKLHKFAEDILALHLNIDISSTPLPFYELLECFNAMMQLSLSCMSKIYSREQIHVMLSMLDKVLRSSTQLLSLEHPGCAVPFMVLRLNVQRFAILVMSTIQESDEFTLDSMEENLYKSCRTASCSIACDSLRWLRCAKLEIKIATLNKVQMGLLQTSVMLLTFIILSAENESKYSNRTICQSFQLDLTELLQSYRVFDVISYHFEWVCTSAALVYRQKEMLGNPAYRVVESILAFVSSVCGNIELLTALILNSQLLQVVLKNSLLTATTEYWAQQKDSGVKFRRGYLQRHDSIFTFTTSSQEHIFIKDPAHEAWRKTLQIVAGLLHVCAENQNQYVLLQEHAAASAIDFLHRFEVDIRIFIESSICKESVTNTNPNTSSPKSGVVFTFATMTELSDLMALLSELCSGLHRKHFESTSPNLYVTMSHAALAVSRSLSSLLGALGTARELFTALKSLNEIMDEDISNSSTALQYRHLANHPLLSDGLPNAKHQAIRNALYASSCCSYVTPEEHSLSLYSVTNATANVPANLEQSFDKYVNNSFICCMEEVASKCLLSALSVIHKVHPSSSAFVSFTAKESKHLDLSSSPPIGAIVAIRPVSSHSSSSNVLLRHGRVIHYNPIARTVDVEYFDKLLPSAERQIEIARLATLEDVTKRITIFEYKPAPYSVSDSDSSITFGDVSLGHLILILRWCQEHAPRISSSSSANGQHLEVTGIANLASIIIGNEIGLHMELNSPAFAPEQVTKEVNSQLLDLFDSEDNLQNFLLNAPTDAPSDMPSLQRIIDAEIWRSVLLQLESSLTAARVDRENAMKNSEQVQPMSANYWVRRTPTGAASRRSPFR